MSRSPLCITVTTPLAGLFICAILLSGLLSGCGFRSPETSTIWDNNTTPVVWTGMPLKEGFCYLTRVAGDFDSTEEWIHVGVLNAPEIGFPEWEVDGGSKKDQYLVATAGCSYFRDFTIKQPSALTPPWIQNTAEPVNVTTQGCCDAGFGWCSDNRPGVPVCGPKGPSVTVTGGGGTASAVLTNSASNSFCYVSGIRGDLGGQDVVYTWIDSVAPNTNPWWMLYVQSWETGKTLFGSAACVTYTPPSETTLSPLSQMYTWAQGQSPTPMIPSNAGVCFLTTISGKFRGKTEYVEIVRTDPKSSAPQLLSGSSNQSGVTAYAQCVLYRQVDIGLKTKVRRPGT